MRPVGQGGGGGGRTARVSPRPLDASSWIVPSTFYETVSHVLTHDCTNALCPKGAVAGHLADGRP